ncbi:MAG TPA: hypothetical protein VG455_13360 [Acidimicrobiales bacterium]|nr:hypothetical protein [Acidimicrobiales bacterium]
MTPDPTPQPLALATVQAVVDSRLDEDDEPQPRQCGRCRMMFRGDPTLDIRARDGWCLCPPCEAILLPGIARRANAIALRRPVQASDDA